LCNRPIRVKLAFILLLPFSAIVGLTGLTVYGAAGRAADAGQARELVVVGGLAAALQAERAAALVFAENGGQQAQDGYRRASAATDMAAEEFLAGAAGAAVPASLASLLARIETNLDGLVSMRGRCCRRRMRCCRRSRFVTASRSPT